MPDFVKQAEQPLYPEIFWNRPTMRSRGGRLLVVGGQRNEFSLVQAVYQMTEAAGIGECQVVLPDSLRRMVGEAGFARFAPSTASGSLGKAALGDIEELAMDFDALVVGANLTNNAETAVMVESLVTKLERLIVVTEETIEILKFHPALITGNPQALVVTTMPGLFALANHHHMPIAIRPNGGLVGKVEIINQLLAISRSTYVVFDQEIIVGMGDEVSVTPLTEPLSDWPAAVISTMATFWLQHRAQPFAALTTAAFVLKTAAEKPPKSYGELAAATTAALHHFDQ